jgi:hypothetical protein
MDFPDGFTFTPCTLTLVTLVIRCLILIVDAHNNKIILLQNKNTQGVQILRDPDFLWKSSFISLLYDLR